MTAAMTRPPFVWQRIVRNMARHYPHRAHLPQALVSVSAQRIFLIDKGVLAGSFPVSTSRFGTGGVWHSFRTPLGAHRVAVKIGEQAPLLTRFVGRQARGQVAPNALSSISDDAICTRILWLDGLEPGYNKGGFFDSMRRYIYIHGTVDEKRIGRPASLGCIRMRNEDVCKVFDVLQCESLVYILQ